MESNVNVGKIVIEVRRVGPPVRRPEPPGGGGRPGIGSGSAGGVAGGDMGHAEAVGAVPAAAGAGCTGRVSGPGGSSPRTRWTREQDEPHDGAEDHAGHVCLPRDAGWTRREELGDEEEPEHRPRRQVDDLQAGEEHGSAPAVAVGTPGTRP